jgi:tetratricopeptide (TPR) repeat protein
MGYIVKMFWPTKLAVLYPLSNTFPPWKVIGAIVILAALSYLAFKYYRKCPWFCVGWLWYLGTLVPVIGLVQVGVQAMADRYTYLPLIGLFIMMAWGVPALLPKQRLQSLILSPLATAIILLLALTSWYQVRHWSNSISLYNHTLSVTDNNYIIHHNLGFELEALGMTRKALEHYSMALQINPSFTDAHINIGFILANQGKYEEAIERFQEAMRINPDSVKGHLNLGYTRLRQGYTGDALRHYSDALRLDPYSADAYTGLGAVMVKIGKIQQAITYFRKADVYI